MKHIFHFRLIISMGIFAMFYPLQNIAQEVISTAGGEYQGNNVSLSYTIGEPVIETFSGGNIVLSQGFQQPYSFYLQQILNIPAGWSSVSTWIDPLNKNAEGLFAPAANQLIILASMSGIYYPAQNINTLGKWNYMKGYQLKAENSFELTVTGSKIPTQELAISQGWSLIPVLSSCDAAVEDLFAGFYGLHIVKEIAGTKIYWPAYNINTLGNLLPGKAYFVASADEGTITFPECTKSSPKTIPLQKQENITPWNDLSYSAASHVVAFQASVLENAGVQPGDVIGAFTTNGLCAGRMEITNPVSNLSITAFANDDLTMEKDGFDNGEPLQFKIYRPESHQEFLLEATFDQALPNMGFFAAHGISAAQSLKLLATGITENPASTFEVYPNPSHGIFNISISGNSTNPGIQITDIRGSIVKETNPGTSDVKIDLSGYPRGLYFLKLYDEGFVGMKKIVVN